MPLVFLGLGSNLHDPEFQIKLAIKHIAEIEQIQLQTRSKFYYSAALIPPERPAEIQPDYVNAVIAITTTLSPLELLKICQQIETQMGRTRSDKRWEARIIDIDLLLYGNLIINSPILTLPHPEMKKRLFVLQPLLEISPNLVLPDGSLIKSLTYSCS